jgi:hypothetical protein
LKKKPEHCDRGQKQKKSHATHFSSLPNEIIEEKFTDPKRGERSKIDYTYCKPTLKTAKPEESETRH